MPSASQSEIETQSPATPHDRPWLFAFLITPEAVISLGLVSGALTYLLRDQGVNPARAASIASLLSLPHAIYFLWGPLTDFWMRRRTWLLLAAAAVRHCARRSVSSISACVPVGSWPAVP